MPPHDAAWWKELVRRLDPDAEANPPADEGQLEAVERSLGVALPAELREFLAEADGLLANYGSAVIWSAAEIDRQNREFRATESFRELYMPFDHLLFFGADAGGDQFAYAIQADGLIHEDDIYRWEHETDTRPCFAARLHQYLGHRLTEEEEEDEDEDDDE